MDFLLHNFVVLQKKNIEPKTIVSLAVRSQLTTTSLVGGILLSNISNKISI